LAGQHDVLGAFAFSDETEVFALHNHSKRFSSVLPHFDCGIVWVVNPIDARIDIDGDAVTEVGGSILKGVINER
jgi:hypothetical protein